MALRSRYQRWQHRHTNRLSSGYFSKLLAFKITSLNLNLKHPSGTSAGQGFIWGNIRRVKNQPTVLLAWRCKGRQASVTDCHHKLPRSALRLAREMWTTFSSASCFFFSCCLCLFLSFIDYNRTTAPYTGVSGIHGLLKRSRRISCRRNNRFTNVYGSFAYRVLVCARWIKKYNDVRAKWRIASNNTRGVRGSKRS